MGPLIALLKHTCLVLVYMDTRVYEQKHERVVSVKVNSINITNVNNGVCFRFRSVLFLF